MEEESLFYKVLCAEPQFFSQIIMAKAIKEVIHDTSLKEHSSDEKN